MNTLEKFFFSVGNQFFLFYNFNTATHGRRKKQNFDFFFFFFFWHGALAFGTRNIVLFETFFSVGNQFFLFNNFNTATHAYGGLKNQIFDFCDLLFLVLQLLEIAPS
jgi:hypothetical protein